MAGLCRVSLLFAYLLAAASGGILALRFPVLALLIAAGRGWCYMQRLPSMGGYSHGTARAATVTDMQKAGFLPGDDGGRSLIMGDSTYADVPTPFQAFLALLSPAVPSAAACRLVIASFWRRSDTGLVRIHDWVHMLTVAPAGAGKSIYVILLNLFNYRGSCVINDPSGEIFKATAWFREKILGRRCIRIDPFGIAGPASSSDCLNPLDFVDQESEDFADQVRDIAEPMVLQDSSKEPHFNQRAVDLIAGITSLVAACEGDPANRNLSVVDEILSRRKAYLEAMVAMQNTPGFHGVLERFGHKMTWVIDRELGSVVSTVHRHMSWLQSPPVIRCLSRSTFDPRWLWSGKVDIYICIPHDRLTTLAGLIRLIISTIIRHLARYGNEQHKVLFILDEIGHCGRIPIVEDAITLWRKSGIRIWLFVQSLNQLKKCYGEAYDTVLDNLGTQQYFGIASYDTAETLSKRVGDYTQIVASINRNAGRSRPDGNAGREPQAGTFSTGWGTTLSEAARRLFKPEEILLLPRDVALLFHKNMPVMPLRLISFFNVRHYKKHGTGREKPPSVAAALLLAAALVLIVMTVLFAVSSVPTL